MAHFCSVVDTGTRATGRLPPGGRLWGPTVANGRRVLGLMTRDLDDWAEAAFKGAYAEAVKALQAANAANRALPSGSAGTPASGVRTLLEQRSRRS